MWDTRQHMKELGTRRQIIFQGLQSKMAAQLLVLVLGLSVVVCVSGVYRPPHYHTPPHTVELDTITFDKASCMILLQVYFW